MKGEPYVLQYFTNAIFLVWGAIKISQGDLKNGLYLLTGFFVLCLLSYFLYKEKEAKA